MRNRTNNKENEKDNKYKKDLEATNNVIKELGHLIQRYNNLWKPVQEIQTKLAQTSSGEEKTKLEKELEEKTANLNIKTERLKRNIKEETDMVHNFDERWGFDIKEDSPDFLQLRK